MKRHIPLLFTILLIAAIGAVYLSYQQQAPTSTPTSQPALTAEGQPVECYTDADCAVAGCSGIQCMPRADAATAVSTCEYKDSYACFAEDNCLCVNNRCNWQGNELFQRCVDRLHGIDCGTLPDGTREQCDTDQAAGTRCAGLTGFDYIDCQQEWMTKPAEIE